MKVNLAKSAGFCFGVKRALKIALETARLDKKVYMLGDIVHNENVVKEIEKAGIKKIQRFSRVKGDTLLIRAHGAGRQIHEKAYLYGYRIVDATCPMVKEIHKIAKDMEGKGYKVIVIGDKKHDEVHGITGQLKSRAIVIDKVDSVPFSRLKGIKKAAVVVQSTQESQKVLKIVGILKRHIEDLRFFNTICMPTSIKQQEIKKLPLENDLMIIIGSKESANTKRLYEISKSLNPHTYWINSEKEIKKNWFKGAKSVGITAGASTPNSTTKIVIEFIKETFPL